MRGIRVPEFGPLPELKHDHRTYFTFTLPPAMMMGVPSGIWTFGKPVLTTITVGADGYVEVVCVDHSVVYGREQVLKRTLEYLKTLPRLQMPETVTAMLSSPVDRERPEFHQITFDAQVSISPGREKPMVA